MSKTITTILAIINTVYIIIFSAIIALYFINKELLLEYIIGNETVIANVYGISAVVIEGKNGVSINKPKNNFLLLNSDFYNYFYVKEGDNLFEVKKKGISSSIPIHVCPRNTTFVDSIIKSRELFQEDVREWTKTLNANDLQKKLQGKFHDWYGDNYLSIKVNDNPNWENK
jgi:hypothetical protein